MTVLPYITQADVAAALPVVTAHLRAGGLIAYPTETVYGFGSLVRPSALAALADLKTRADTKPFLLLVRDASDLPQLVWNDAARRLAAAFWPGALTLALPAREELPERVVSESGTVAVRATPHEGMRALLHAVGEPITSTSANAPGGAPAMTGDEVASLLETMGADHVLVLDGGALPASRSSTLLDCSNERPRVIRAGAITLDAIRQVVELDD